MTFSEVSAFRALDEGGLPEFWWETKARGGRPGLTTFRVRNHAWSHESFLSFFHGTAEGWSHVIATDGLCVEVVARNPPEITLETPAPSSWRFFTHGLLRESVVVAPRGPE